MEGVPHPSLRSAVPLVLGVGQVNFEPITDITSAAWQPATRCLILGVGFSVRLSNKNITEIEGLRDVAKATHFGTKLL